MIFLHQGSLNVPMFHITQPLDSIRYMVFFMATILGDVQYSQVMGHLPTPVHLKRTDETIQKLLTFIQKLMGIKTSMSPCPLNLCQALDLGHVSSVASEVSEAMAEVAF